MPRRQHGYIADGLPVLDNSSLYPHMSVVVQYRV